MAWGKRTAPPAAKGGVPEVMHICDECTSLTGIVFSEQAQPLGNREFTMCEGCGKRCDYVLWELATDQWFNLEVQLAVKEGTTHDIK